MRKDDLSPAIAAYEDYLVIVAGRELTRAKARAEAQAEIVEETPSSQEQQQLLLRYSELLGTFPERVAASRRKDMERGKRIIPDYERTHAAPEDEQILQQFRLEIDKEREQIENRLNTR